MKDATNMLDMLLDQIRLAKKHEDARATSWQLHGAARMAYRLGVIDYDTWRRYEDEAESIRAAKLEATRQLTSLDD